MTFLNPAFLIGLIATVVPVLLHLLNLRKLKLIEFSTLVFLKELQKNKIRRIKLKQLLLLVLRFLIILFVVSSFARPTLQGVSVGGVASSAKTTAVFIIDNSFSMSAVNDNGSNFNRAKQIIKSLMNELQEGDEAALVPVSGASGYEIKSMGSSLSEFRKAVDNLELSSESGTINGAIVRAAGILGGSHNFNKEIYLLTDFQKSGLIETNQTPLNLGELLNDKVKLYSFNFSGKELFNLGIDRLELNNQIPEKNKSIRFTADITNYSQTQKADNVGASLFINGQRSAQQSVSLESGETKKVIFETILKSAGYIDVSAELEDDDILQDNKRFLNFTIPEKVSVIIFTDNEADARFVELALNATGEGANIAKKNLKELSSVNLNGYDAVFVIGSSRIDFADRLTNYLINGGSIFLMPGSNSTPANFGALSSRLQLPESVAATGSLNSMQSIAVFDHTDFQHPLFSDMFARQAKKQVESPEIYYYFRSNPGGKGKSVISMIDNSSFLSEYSVGKGRALVMYSAPLLSWSNFPLKGLFAPLINKSVYYLASKDNKTANYLSGQSAALNLQNNALPQIKIVRPDKNEEFITIEKNRNIYYSYSNTNLTGNYKVYSSDRLIDFFAVNNNPPESGVKMLSPGEFSSYLTKINFRGKEFRLDAGDNYTKRIQQARFGSELWRYFLLVALILALAEMFISGSTKKDLA
ncbi:MAG: BatA domain-containing protein [Ignavibacteria bacterium]